ncbi:MAG: hypothetical protein ACT4OS_01615 [Acidimicrobiales bacterium]
MGISAVTIVTLVGVGIIVAALAFYLIAIASTLTNVSFTVGTVLVGVRSIAQACEPLAPAVRDIASNVGAIDEGFEALVTGGEPRSRKVAGGLPHGTAAYRPRISGF